MVQKFAVILISSGGPAWLVLVSVECVEWPARGFTKVGGSLWNDKGVKQVVGG